MPEGKRHARVIAIGTSQVTERPFNLIVAFEKGSSRPRRWAHLAWRDPCQTP